MVDVIGKAKVIVETAIDKSSLDTSSGKIGAGIKKGALIGVAALGTLAVAGVRAAQAFEQAEAQSRKLNQVLDNMGEGKATPAVEKLADELMRLTGVDDEVIKGGQTILATFSEVAESAGDVGGTFERATKASLDLAAAGFGSVESASVMLGKALQDPAKGITALGRAGVTFTETQKEQIKNFIETNDLAAAQALILGEVEKQVKGTAEANATESAKISAAWGEIQESIGHALDELTDGRVTNLSDSMFALADSIDNLAESDGLEVFGDVLETTGDIIGWTVGKFLEFSEWLGKTKLAIDTFSLKIKGPLLTAQLLIGGTFKFAVEAIGKALRSIEKTIPDWAKAGGKILTAFVKGMATGGIPGVLASRIKDAINDALPDEITFFGGKGGIPAITIPIPQLASGTRNFSGGLAMVGETGPELVSLPAGSNVYNAQETRRMTAADGGAAVVNNWNFYGPESLSQARQQEDWARSYGTRFGSATRAVTA